MGILSKLFRRRQTEFGAFRASADVRYDDRAILISANKRHVGGLFVHGEPAALLARQSAATDIGDAVLRALRGSCDGLSEAEAANQAEVILRLSGDPSWDKMDKRWQLIVAIFADEADSLILSPMGQYEGGGYVGEEGDPSHKTGLGPTEIGERLLAVINAGPLSLRRRVR